MARQQIDFPVQQHQISTPSSPPAGSMKLYPKTDNKFYYLTPAGVEKPMGAEDPLVVNNATVNQVLQIGTSADNRIKTPANALNSHLTLESTTGHTFLAAGINSHVTSNAYWDGTNWLRFNTAGPASYWGVSSGSVNFNTAPAGANPVGWTSRFLVDSAGNVTVSGTLAATGNITSSGDIVAAGSAGNKGYLLTSDGSNGLVRATVGSLYLRSASTQVAIDGSSGLLVTNRVQAQNYVTGDDGRIYYHPNLTVYCTMTYPALIFTNLQLQANRVNAMTEFYNPTAAVGGAPPYIAGQAGDGFLHWYPKSSVAGCSAVGAGTAGTGGLSGSYSGDLGGVYAPRTGLAHISCIITSNGDDAALHIFRNGGLAVNGGSANGGQNTTFAIHANLNVNVNDYISIRATGDGNSGLSGGYILMTVGTP